MNDTILLVDDEPEILKGQRLLLELNGFQNILEAQSIAAAREIITNRTIALVLLDLTMPDEPGQEFLSFARTNYPETEVIVVTGAADLSVAVECMKAGACDFLVKGTDSSRIPAAVRKALQHRATTRENRLLREAFTRTTPRRPGAFEDFITESDNVRRILVYVEALSSLPDPILIIGETGVGKELIARGIHRAGEINGEFVPINLGGVDDHIFSDTLFGHRRGAFTGADSTREGLVARAAGGTLFLDEIGEMPAETQTRLLRLLDSGEYRPLGSDQRHYCRARIVCATNRDLPTAVQAGRFRRDLYYRISTHTVLVPPLRDRPEDIPPILEHLIAGEAARLQRPAVEPSPRVMRLLQKQELPGNVRELHQIVLRVLLAGSWDTFVAEHLKVSPGNPFSPHDTVQVEPVPPVAFGNPLPSPQEVISALLQEADRRHPNSRTSAARAIGLSLQSFSNRWKRLGL